MSRKLLRFRHRGLYPLPHSPNRGVLGVEVEVVKLNVIGVLRRGPCLELLAMNFHEQRRVPSRPLFSRTRACPCLRAGFDTRSRCLLRMPPFLAQKAPLSLPQQLSQCTGPRQPMIDPAGVACLASHPVGEHVGLR